MPSFARRGTIAWVAVSLAVVAAALGAALLAVIDRDPGRPNVLLVSIDSLRADRLGAYGHAKDTSPEIDALGREGTVFEWAISSAPWTIPAHATMLTGLAPEVHGVTSYRKSLAPEAITLAEVLRDAGWETAAIVSGPTVAARYGFDQGFASWDESLAETDHFKARRNTTSPGLVGLVDAFLRRWSDGGRKAPFFVFLHMWDVHYDYAPPPPYDSMFDPGYQGAVTGDDYLRNPAVHRRMAPRDLDHVRALYDGEIRFTDEHLGRIVATLRDLGVLDDTIVVVTADHGDEFFEHGMKGHGVSLFDEVLRVPLVVRYPRRVPGAQRVTEQVRLMDVPTTILGLARVAAPQGFGAAGLRDPHRAADLTPWIAAGPSVERPALPAFSQTRMALPHDAVRTRDAKLIHVENERAGTTRSLLYDLVADPGEKADLGHAKVRPAFSPGLEAMLAAWHSDAAQQEDVALDIVPPPAHEAKLRALGYVE